MRPREGAIPSPTVKFAISKQSPDDKRKVSCRLFSGQDVFSSSVVSEAFLFSPLEKKGKI